MRFRDDTRGASITVTHALTIGITTILISGLLLSSGSLLRDQQERVTERAFNDIGESIVNEVLRIDRLAEGDVNSDITSRVPYTQRVGGQNYEIAIDTLPNGNGVITVKTIDGTIDVPVRVRTEASICEREVNGGPIKVVYDADEECLTIRPSGR